MRQLVLRAVAFGALVVLAVGALAGIEDERQPSPVPSIELPGPADSPAAKAPPSPRKGAKHATRRERRPSRVRSERPRPRRERAAVPIPSRPSPAPDRSRGGRSAPSAGERSAGDDGREDDRGAAAPPAVPQPQDDAATVPAPQPFVNPAPATGAPAAPPPADDDESEGAEGGAEE